MEKNNDFLNRHVQMCYVSSLGKRYYVSFQDCLDMVYENKEIPIFNKLNDKTELFAIIHYNKNKKEIIEEYVSKQEENL